MPVDPDLSSVAPSGRRFLAFAPLVRALGLASDPRKLVLGLLGLAVLIVGWRVIDLAFQVDPRQYARLDPGATIDQFDVRYSPSLGPVAILVAEPARNVIDPFLGVFSRGSRLVEIPHALALGVWAVIVWGIIGGAIARIAVLQLTVGGGVGVGTALRFALGRATALIIAPLTPFLAVGLIAFGCAGFGLLYWIPGGIGATIAGFLGFVPLVGGLVMAIILIGLALGWPLMHATVAAEGEDVADALSRSYSYVNQRLLRYLAHLAVAWGLGIVGLVGALIFARVVLSLADWGIALGAPDRPTTIPLAEGARFFWSSLVGWLVHSYLYSYFWSAGTVIYLILREDVDGTDPYDVYLPDQALDTFAGPATPAAIPVVVAPITTNPN